MRFKANFFLSKLLILTLLLLVLVLPIRSQAMTVVDFGAIGSTIAQTAKDVGTFIWEKAASLYEIAAQYVTSQAVMQSIDIFAQRLATQTATTIASSGSGLHSLFESRVFEDIMKDAAGAAAGDFIGAIAEDWEKESGINLCNPRLDLKYTIAYNLILLQSKEGIAPARAPKCDLAAVVQNWENFIDTVDLPGMSLKGEGNKAVESILKGLQEGMRPGNNDFTITMTMNDKLISKRAASEEAAKFTAQGFAGGYNPKENTTGTQIQTGSGDVSAVAKTPITSSIGQENSKAGPAALNITGVLSRALSTFTNSLASQLLQRWIREGLYNLAKVKNNQAAITMPTCPGCAQTGGTGGGTGGGSLELAAENIFTAPVTPEAVDNYYAGMFTVSLGTSEQYNPLLDYNFCPEQKEMIGINNCVLDQKWYNLFSRNDNLTIQQAIDLKLIDRNIPLISETDAKNTDIQYCYKQALCFSNLQKMRLARLIPLGWEIAASQSDGNVTLGQVIDCFNNEQCELNQKRNISFSKLIDPDWLLKAPTAICRAKGFGPKLQAANVASRAEICADAPTCLQENDFAACKAGAYGYCTREKNVWRFGGEQCSPQYASCRSYEQQGSTNYWIKDSLEYCTSDQVGCRWYSRTKELDSNVLTPISGSENLKTDICNGTAIPIFPDNNTAAAFCKLKGYAGGAYAGGDVEQTRNYCKYNGSSWVVVTGNYTIPDNINCFGMNWTNTQVVYLNSQAKSCNATDAGCQQLLKVGDGLNLIANGDFILDNDSNGRPDGWNEVNWTTNLGYENGRLKVPYNWQVVQKNIPAQDNTVYTISLSAAQVAAVNSGIARAVIGFCNTQGNCDEQGSTPNGITASIVGTSSVCYADKNFIYLSFPPASTDPQQESCSFKAASGSAKSIEIFLLSNGGSSQAFSNPLKDCGAGENPLYNDEASATAYCREQGFSQGVITSSDTLDRIPMCQYTNGQWIAVNNDDGFITQVKCLGDEVWMDNVQLETGEGVSDYTEYGTTNFTYLKRPPYYLYCDDPNRASLLCSNYSPSCSAEDVGCELYTPQNGDPAVPGVVKEENYCPAECAGYNHYLKRRTAMEEQFNDTAQNTGVNMIASSGKICSVTDVGCEEFTDISNNEQKVYYSKLRMCVDATDPNIRTYYTWEGSDTSGYQLKTWRLLKSDYEDGEPVPAPCTSVVYDAANSKNICSDNEFGFDNCGGNKNDPTCRVYLDENNNEYLRREYKVIAAATSCQKIRRTIDPNDFAVVVPSESTTCSVEVANCHEYKGNDGSNIQQIFMDDFESDAGEWTGVGATLSTESGMMGGHSLKVNVEQDSRIYKNVQLQYGRAYTLSFWAKSYDQEPEASLHLFAGTKNGEEFTNKFTFYNSDISLSTKWQKFEYGPIYYNYETGAPTTPENLTLKLQFSLAEGSIYFVDNIILKEISSDVYLVDNSWSNGELCEPYLGCQAYNDRANNTHYLYSFYHICQENKVGCQQFIDTKNSSYPFAKQYSAGNILKNSNFEGDYDNNGVPDNWMFWNNVGESMSVKKETTDVYNGTKAIKLSGNGSATNHDNWIVANQYVAVKPNTTYYFTGYVKAIRVDGADSWGSVEIIAKLGVDKPRKLPRVSYDIWLGSNGMANLENGVWTKQQKTFTTDSTTYGLEITCAMSDGTNGKASSLLCDNFVLGEALTEPADEVVYVVDDQKYYCSSSAKGCTTMGKPTLGINDVGGEVVKSWSSVNYILDPDIYERILCDSQSVGCEQFKSDGQIVNVKNPNANTCTYLSDFIYNGTPYPTGWYKTYSIPNGSNNLLADEIMKSCARKGGQLINGKMVYDEDYSLPRRTDDDWQGLAGVCDAKNNGCNELVDPQATQGQNLLDNGNFEQESSAISSITYNLPDYWLVDLSGRKDNLQYYTGSNNSWLNDFVRSKFITGGTPGKIGKDGSYGISLYAGTHNKPPSNAQSSNYKLENNNYAIYYDKFWLASYLNQDISTLEPKVTYNVSVDLKNQDAVSTNKFVVGISCNQPIESIDNSFAETGSSLETVTVGSQKYYNGYKQFTLSPDTKYNTYSFKFNTKVSDSKCYLLLFGATPGSKQIWVDNVRLQKVQSYYYINSNQINEGDCNGQVSWSKGCIAVLDKSNISLTTGELVKSYNSTTSYQKSVVNNGSKVPAEPCSSNNSSGCDSNRIIKVRADRECGEWLSCSSWAYYTDQKGNVVPSCYDLNRCQQLDPENPNTCLSWVDVEPTALTTELYQNRQTGWSGMDYSSYSLHNTYPLDGLSVVDYDKSGDINNYYLTYIQPSSGSDIGYIGNGKEKIAKRCRLYPEQEAPFVISDNTLTFDEYGNISSKPGSLSQANFCQPGSNCDCDYYKVEYDMSEVRYYGISSSIPTTIDYNDYNASTTPDPASKLKNKGEYRGWWGYCLEQDRSRRIFGSSGSEYPCTTWMPLDMVTGDFNIFGGSAITSTWPYKSYYCAVADGSGIGSSNLVFHNSNNTYIKYKHNMSDPLKDIILDVSPANSHNGWSGYSDGHHHVYIGEEDRYIPSGYSDKNFTFLFGAQNMGAANIRNYPVYYGHNFSCLPDLNSTDHISGFNASIPSDSVLDNNQTQIIFNRVKSKMAWKGGVDYKIDTMPTNVLVSEANKFTVTESNFNSLTPTVLTLLNAHFPEAYLNKDIYIRCFSADLDNNWSEVINQATGKADLTKCSPDITTYPERYFMMIYYYVKDSAINNETATYSGECSTNDGDGGFVVGTVFQPAGYQNGSTLFASGPADFAYLAELRYSGTSSPSSNMCQYVVGGFSPKATVVANGIDNFIYPLSQGTGGISNENNMYGVYKKWMSVGDIDPFNRNTAIYLQPKSQAGTVYGVNGYQVEWDGSDNGYGVDLRAIDDAHKYSVLSAINQSDIISAWNTAKGYLSQIFNGGSVYLWDNDIERYASDGVSSWSPPVSSLVNPKVNAVKFDAQNNKYSEVNNEGKYYFSLNNIYDQNIVRYSRAQNVTLNFYAYSSDGNQSPLKRIYVNWGDGNVVDYQGHIRNHKESCERYCSNSNMLLGSYDIGSFKELTSSTPSYLITPRGWQSNIICDNTGNYASIKRVLENNEYVINLNTKKGSAWAGIQTNMPVVAGKTYILSFQYKVNNINNYAQDPARLIVQSYCQRNTVGCDGSENSDWVSTNDINFPFVYNSDSPTVGYVTKTIMFKAKFNNPLLRIFIPYDQCRVSNSSGAIIDCSGGVGCATGNWSNTYGNGKDRDVYIKNVKVQEMCDTHSDCSAKLAGSTCVANNVSDAVGMCIDNAENLSSVGFFSLNHIYLCTGKDIIEGTGTQHDGQFGCSFTPTVYVQDYAGACTKQAGLITTEGCANISVRSLNNVVGAGKQSVILRP